MGTECATRGCGWPEGRSRWRAAAWACATAPGQLKPLGALLLVRVRDMSYIILYTHMNMYYILHILYIIE